MTHRTSARVAGVGFLAYIALGVLGMRLSRGMPDATDTVARLQAIGAHLDLVRTNMLLGLATALIALTLAVTLHAITRGVDEEIARLAMIFRIGEGFSIMIPTMASLGLIWLAGGSGGGDGVALAGLLLKVKAWNVVMAALFFAVGSTLFSWLFLRGLLIPAPLAWLGIIASVLLVVTLPSQLVNGESLTMLHWIPMGVFEVVLALWLIVKGVREPARA